MGASVKFGLLGHAGKLGGLGVIFGVIGVSGVSGVLQASEHATLHLAAADNVIISFCSSGFCLQKFSHSD